MTTSGAPHEIELSVHGRRIAALVWRRTDNPVEGFTDPATGPEVTRVLALHGWLDNAASFSRLAELLPAVELVAIDFAGHGRSDHLPDGCWYHHIDSIDEVLAMLDALGWPRATLLGHSMGGACACLVAAARPDRVDALWLIEGLGPLSVESDQALSLLRRAHAQRRERGNRGLRVFPNLDAAVAARQLGVSNLSSAAAAILVERGTRKVDGGWQWSSDPRLTLASPQRATPEQVIVWLGGIECPTLLLLAEPAATFISPAAIALRMAAVPTLKLLHLPGNHHLHLEDPGPVAAAIAAFRASASPVR